MQKVTPFLWFDNRAQEAMHFYVSIFKDSKIINDSPMSVQFELNGQKFVGFNGGPMFHFNEAISFAVTCDTQEEIDYYWEKLTGEGGVESRCGWLKDKFGLSWQIIPKDLPVFLTSTDRVRAGRATAAMMEMNKIDVEKIRKAFEGV